MSEHYQRALFSISLRSFPVCQQKIKADRDVSPRVTEKASYLLLLQLQQGSLCPPPWLGTSVKVPPLSSSSHPQAARNNRDPCGSSLPPFLRCGGRGRPSIPTHHGIPWHGVGWYVAQSSRVDSFIEDYQRSLLPILSGGKELAAAVSPRPCPSPFPAMAPC